MTAAALLPVWEAAGLGFTGGLVPDGLRLLNARHDPLPTYLRTRFFWVSLSVLAVLGAIVSALSHPSTLQAALALSYSAPSIVSALGGKTPEISPHAALALDAAARKPSLVEQVRRWWAR